MKKFRSTFAALMCIFISHFSGAQDVATTTVMDTANVTAVVSVRTARVESEARLPGNYRQILFLPQAVSVGNYYHKIDTLIALGDSLGTVLLATILGKRNADEFQITISTADEKRSLITSQTFYMNGEPSDTWAFNTWFSSQTWFSRKQLNQVLSNYFGILMVPRNEFLKLLAP